MDAITTSTLLTSVRNYIEVENPDRRKLLELAESARKIGREEVQIEITQSLISKFPNDIGVIHFHTIALLNNKFIKKALYYSELAIETKDKSLRTLDNRFEALYSAGEYDKANLIAEEMEKLFPRHIRSYVTQIKIALKDIDIDKYLKALEKSHLNTSQSENENVLHVAKSIEGCFHTRLDMKKNNIRPKHTIFLASGGLTHMLSALGACLAFCRINDSICVPVTSVNPHFQMDFFDIFKIRDKKYEYRNANIVKTKFERDSIISAYGLNDRYKCKTIRSIKDADGTVFYVLGSENNVRSLDMKKEFQEDYTELSGFVHGKWPIEDRLEYALENIELLDTIKKSISNRINGIEKPYIGVHFRNTDYKNDLDETFRRIELYASGGDFDSIYFATDDPDSLLRTRERYANDFNVINFSSQISIKDFGAINTHGISDDALRRHGLSKRDLIEDFFVDIAMLSHSAHFVPSGLSSVTYLVQLLRRRLDLRGSFLVSSADRL